MNLIAHEFAATRVDRPRDPAVTSGRKWVLLLDTWLRRLWREPRVGPMSTDWVRQAEARLARRSL